MIGLSWNNEITGFYSTKTQHTNNKLSYYRISIYKLSLFWMESKKARKMMISETTAKLIIKGEYAECSKDPNSCPENEGYGCCGKYT